MEVSALRYSGGIGLHGRSPLLRLQSDERLIALIRRGNSGAFEILVSRYHSRLLAFCRHLLGSKEDAEDVLQEVMAAAFNAILADERPINVRPWLYRIARNRSLNHLRRIQAIGVDSMDIHFSEFGATTADKVHDRERFRLLVRDIQTLPETQRTALVLREMDALSYEQIAEAMDTTVPGVKSLLVRARISLAEAAEARQLSCEEVRIELAEVAEGLRKRPEAIVRRHLRSCNRCATFQGQLKHTNKALAALLPIGPIALLRKLLIVHIGHSAGTGSAGGVASAGTAGAASATTATGGALAGGTAALGSAGSLATAGAGALATKAAAGLAAAALVTAGAVEASHVTKKPTPPPVAAAAAPMTGGASVTGSVTQPAPTLRPASDAPKKPAATTTTTKKTTTTTASTTTTAQQPKTTVAATKPDTGKTPTTAGQTQTQTDPTVLAQGTTTTGQATDTTTTTTTTPTTTTPTTTTTSNGSGTGCGSPSGGAAPTPSSGPGTSTTSTTSSSSSSSGNSTGSSSGSSTGSSTGSSSGSSSGSSTSTSCSSTPGS